MNSIISMDEMAQIIREQFDAGGEKVSFTPKGISMLPMLRDNLDKVVLEKKIAPLKKYDLPLYVREDGKYILHRVVRVKKDGSYDMCGDNQITVERQVKHSQIIGVVTSFESDGVWHSCNEKEYMSYCKKRVALLPYRRIIRVIKKYSNKVVKKLVRGSRKIVRGIVKIGRVVSKK